MMSEQIDSLNFETNANDLSEAHRTLQTKTVDALRRILAHSSILRDIACDVTPEEIRAQIAIVNGDSIAVYVKRDPYPKLKVIVPADRRTTVAVLKQAIQRNHTLQQQRRRISRTKIAAHEKRQRRASDVAASTSAAASKSSSTSAHQQNDGKNSSDVDDNEPIRTKISWKYIWRTYHLECDGTILRDDRRPLVDCGIRNKTVLGFVKKSKADRKMRKKKKK